jgi:hypothetical protein
MGGQAVESQDSSMWKSVNRLIATSRKRYIPKDISIADDQKRFILDHAGTDLAEPRAMR